MCVESERGGGCQYIIYDIYGRVGRGSGGLRVNKIKGGIVKLKLKGYHITNYFSIFPKEQEGCTLFLHDPPPERSDPKKT